MKRLKKFRLRALAFTLCAAILLGSVSASATSLKEDANWQAKHSEWTPEEAAIDIPNTAGDLTNEQLQTAGLSSEDTPEIVTDEVIAENNHVNRLWEQEPNDNTIIFQNKDGSKTAYFYSRPVKYTDANGEKHDKRNMLVSTVDNAKYAEDYGYVNACNDIKTYYPSSIRPEKGMVLETPDLTVELSPLSAIEKRYVLSDGRELTSAEYEVQAAVTGFAEPEAASITDAAEIRETVRQAGTAAAQKGQIQEIGSRAKDTVQYKDVFGSKTSIRYSSTFEGFKEDIILDENIGVNEFKFRLKTNGLSLVDTGDGNYCLVDPLTGKAKAAVGDLVVTDSKPQPEPKTPTKEDALEETSEQPENETAFAEVQYAHHYEAETVTPEQEYILTVVVDEAYLNDPETVYPVYVDPTMTVMGSGDIEDVSLYSNINYTLGSTESQQIKIGYNSSLYGTGRALYDFPILDFNTDFIFLYGNQISSARLNLYCLPYGNGSSYDEAKTLSLYEFYSQWSPSTVKWNNTNPYNYGCLINSKSVTYGWTAFDISYVIDKFKTDSDYTTDFMDRGLMLKAASETSSTWKKFASSEYTSTSYRPYIQITYNDSPPACPQVVSGAVYYIKSYYPDYALDVYNGNTTDNTRLLQFPFHGGTNQQFRINNITGGEYEIVPQHTTGKLLSVNTSNEVIIEQDCNLTRQRWYIFYRNGSYHFVNKQNNTKVMEATYDSDYVYTSNNYDYCDWEISVVKEAIVIMPGMMASEINLNQTAYIDFMSDYGNPLVPGFRIWDPNTDYLPYLGSIVRLLGCNNNGTPQYQSISKGPTINKNPTNYPEGSYQYGAMDTFRRLYKKLYDEFYIPGKVDIVLYEYDWRKDPYDVALEFDTFINNNYGRIKLIAHSMGGLVSSQYMALGQAQRDRITQYISVAVPYLGAPLAQRIYCDGKFYDPHGFKDWFVGSVANATMAGAIRDIAPNIKTLYALTPPSQHFRPYLVDEWAVPTEEYTDYNSTMQFFSQNQLNWNSNICNLVKTNQDRLFVNGTQVTRLINDAYYIIGMGEMTATSLTAFRDMTYDLTLSDVNSYAGDGTVPLWSATIGGTLASHSKVFYKSSSTGMSALHTPMIQGIYKDAWGDDVVDYSTINFIIEIVEGNAMGFSSSTLSNTYGMTKTMPELY